MHGGGGRKEDDAARTSVHARPVDARNEPPTWQSTPTPRSVLHHRSPATKLGQLCVRESSRWSSTGERCTLTLMVPSLNICGCFAPLPKHQRRVILGFPLRLPLFLLSEHALTSVDSLHGPT